MYVFTDSKGLENVTFLAVGSFKINETRTKFKTSFGWLVVLRFYVPPTVKVIHRQV